MRETRVSDANLVLIFEDSRCLNTLKHVRCQARIFLARMTGFGFQMEKWSMGSGLPGALGNSSTSDCECCCCW